MKKLLPLLFLLLPVVASAYSDHRGRNLDSLERITARYTPDRLLHASDSEKMEYALACRDLAWGYLNIDGAKCVYYARQAISIAEPLGGRNTVFDMSILIGQVFWAKEQYDSARVHYRRAEDVLKDIEDNWTDPDKHDLEASQARIWATLGNFYAMQDSVEQFTKYYGKAGELFEKWEWWEDCSTLHRNLGEIYIDYGDMEKSRREYGLALEYAEKSKDSLMIAGAMYGMGRWYKEAGKTAKALKYLAQADEYYGNHPREEAIGRADTLAVMNEARKELFRNARIIVIGSFLLLLLFLAALMIARRLKHAKKELSETSAVLDETIEDLRPAKDGPEPGIRLTRREKDVARLLIEGLPTKQIAHVLGIGDETVLWYRKRLYAKLDVHSAPAFTAEVLRRGLLD